LGVGGARRQESERVARRRRGAELDLDDVVARSAADDPIDAAAWSGLGEGEGDGSVARDVELADPRAELVGARLGERDGPPPDAKRVELGAARGVEADLDRGVAVALGLELEDARERLPARADEGRRVDRNDHGGREDELERRAARTRALAMSGLEPG